MGIKLRAAGGRNMPYMSRLEDVPEVLRRAWAQIIMPLLLMRARRAAVCRFESGRKIRARDTCSACPM